MVNTQVFCAGAEVAPVAGVADDAAERFAGLQHFEKQRDDGEFGGGRDAVEEGGVHEVDAAEEVVGRQAGVEQVADVADAVGGRVEGDVARVIRIAAGAQDEGDEGAGRAVLRERGGERQVGEDVAVIDPEGFVARQQVGDVFDAAGGFEQHGLVAEMERAAAVGVVGEGGGVSLGAVVRVDDETLDAGVGDEVVEGESDERLADHRHERFWQCVGERAQPGAEAGAEDEGGHGVAGCGLRVAGCAPSNIRI